MMLADIALLPVTTDAEALAVLDAIRRHCLRYHESGSYVIGDIGISMSNFYAVSVSPESRMYGRSMRMRADGTLPRMYRGSGYTLAEAVKQLVDTMMLGGAVTYQ